MPIDEVVLAEVEPTLVTALDADGRTVWLLPGYRFRTPPAAAGEAATPAVPGAATPIDTLAVADGAVDLAPTPVPEMQPKGTQPGSDPAPGPPAPSPATVTAPNATGGPAPDATTPDPTKPEPTKPATTRPGGGLPDSTLPDPQGPPATTTGG
ncbi:MAG: hypothetical protein HYX34_05170 [Actinobacteria bacterium]|nr:hypothetical protein [Actinomycetota bacterium]